MSRAPGGPIALLGSAADSPALAEVVAALSALAGPARGLAVLETPAGFAPDATARALAFATAVQQAAGPDRPQVSLIAARGRETDQSPDDTRLLAPLKTADWIALGGGSPTYALRQLQASRALDFLRERSAGGAPLLLADAAAMAFGAFTLPLFEIISVGLPLHWAIGLDFFAPLGLSLVVVPDWDGDAGAASVDTRFGGLGLERYERLLTLLPAGQTLVGIERGAALLILPATGEARALGSGKVYAGRPGALIVLRAGERISLQRLTAAPRGS